MKTLHNSLPDKEPVADATPPAPSRPVTSARQSLPAKGSCWYCEKPLDAVRRFCGKECAAAFDEEAAFDQ
ncbi:hypothetical protein [Massilia sp. TS11]|uniref:hypothetical protein n=1 Tax=Massilia sp. TS11 TaxID=2908003 RepID=UPI001EDA18ED|nr:hypothetical protein [Massilia sp. TS11]MCG2586611.1 hypothetical protein [Massilia sp. TS11]